MKIETMRTDELIPYENNPRQNDDAVPFVKDSIVEFGFKVPIVVDKYNVVIAGHTRLKAAILLKMKTVPVIRATDLNDKQVDAFRLADNKVGEAADWDNKLLQAELKKLEDDFDMSMYGFEELEEEAEKAAEDTVEYEPSDVIIIEFDDEDERDAALVKLDEEGYNCRIGSI